MGRGTAKCMSRSYRTPRNEQVLVNRGKFDVKLDAAAFNPMKIGAYIQVPFCQTKCTYCNFHTGVVARERYGPYADAVCREITEAKARELGGDGAAEIDTVYFGGGTPSLLEPAALRKILDALRGGFGFARGGEPEITLEADPETITGEKAAAWLADGI
jgi:oxygen-independent coproporphyrinogen-3 oxidase